MSDEFPWLKKVAVPGAENDEAKANDLETASNHKQQKSHENSSGVANASEALETQSGHDFSENDTEKKNVAGEDVAEDNATEEHETNEREGRMGVLEHLQEFRKCLTRMVLAVVLGFLPCYAVAAKLFTILMQPMNDAMSKVSAQASIALTPDFFKVLESAIANILLEKGEQYAEQTALFVASLQSVLQNTGLGQSRFIYTYPPEAFFAEVKVAFVAGFFLVSPYLFFQLWKFVAPGLYAHERRWIWPIAFLSALFFVTGACFGYFVVFPVGFEFFAQFSTESISFMPKLSEYLGFALKLLIAFGVAFELPVFLFFLARMGIVTGQGLLRKGKYFVLVAFIIGAILTPPDPVSQSLMAGPLILLYALGVAVAFLFGKKKKTLNKTES